MTAHEADRAPRTAAPVHTDKVNLLGLTRPQME